MIRPRRSRSMPFAARLVRRNVPVRLVSITDDQSSSDIRRSSVSAVIPAFGDEHLDGSVGRLGLGERRLDGRGVRDVTTQVERSLRAAAGPRRDRDVVAQLEEGLGDRAADAAVASGDQDGPRGDVCRWGLLGVAHGDDASDYPSVVTNSASRPGRSAQEDGVGQHARSEAEVVAQRGERAPTAHERLVVVRLRSPVSAAGAHTSRSRPHGRLIPGAGAGVSRPRGGSRP